MQIDGAIIESEAPHQRTNFPIILPSVREREEESNRTLFKEGSLSSDQSITYHGGVDRIPTHYQSLKKQQTDEIRIFMRKADALNINTFRKLKEENQLPQFPKNQRSSASLYKHSLRNIQFYENEELEKEREIKKIYLGNKKNKPRKVFHAPVRRKVGLVTKEVQTEEKIISREEKLKISSQINIANQRQSNFSNYNNENMGVPDQYYRTVPPVRELKQDAFEETLPKRNKNSFNFKVNNTISLGSSLYNQSSTNANSRLQSMSKLSYHFHQGIQRASRDSRQKQYKQQQTIFNCKTLDAKPFLPAASSPFQHLFETINQLSQKKQISENKINKTTIIPQQTNLSKVSNILSSRQSKYSPIFQRQQKQSEKETLNFSIKSSRNNIDSMSIIAQKTQPNSINQPRQQQINFATIPVRQSRVISLNENQRSGSPQQRIRRTKKGHDYLVQVPSFHELKVNQQSQESPSGVKLKITALHPIRNDFDQSAVDWITKKYKPKSQILNNIDLHSFQIKKYKNGVYFGELNDKKQKHGKGVIFYFNGRTYEGDFVEDLKHGRGHESYPDGSFYKGDFYNGVKDGRGIFEWLNGEVYDGQWQKGKKSGSGMWKSAEGESYLGEWNKGRVEGFGVFVMNNGSRYEGEFKNSLKHGVGTERFENGETFVGSYQKNRPSGQGEYFWANGDYYKGNFSNGLRHGFGHFKDHKKGQEYKGEYRNDKKCGYGQLIFPDGVNYLGNFENNLRHGFGKLYEGQKCIYEGYWINDQQVENQLIPPIIEEELQRQQSLPNNPKKVKAKFGKIPLELAKSNKKSSKSKSPHIHHHSGHDDPGGVNFTRTCGCNRKH